MHALGAHEVKAHLPYSEAHVHVKVEGITGAQAHLMHSCPNWRIPAHSAHDLPKSIPG
jgi:hypothetical protein